MSGNRANWNYTTGGFSWELVVLNTSFIENEPVVRRSEGAPDCYLRSKMDVFVIEN